MAEIDLSKKVGWVQPVTAEQSELSRLSAGTEDVRQGLSRLRKPLRLLGSKEEVLPGEDCVLVVKLNPESPPIGRKVRYGSYEPVSGAFLFSEIYEIDSDGQRRLQLRLPVAVPETELTNGHARVIRQGVRRVVETRWLLPG